MKGVIAALAICCLVPVTAFCDDAPPSPPPPQGVWTGKGQAGFADSKGNTDAKSANAALDAGYLDGPWTHAVHLGGLYSESGDVVSAERWDTKWQTNYAFTKEFYGFGGLRYEHDLFSGFQYQASATSGLGYKLIDTNSTTLALELGLGFRELRPEDLTTGASGLVTSRTLEPSENGVVETVGLNYSQAFTQTTTLTDKLLVETGSNDTLVTNTLALAVKISTKLALSVGYNVQDNNDPPGGVKKLDTLETLNLVYAF
jgi:putative salt-induced outer membrane protein